MAGRVMGMELVGMLIKMVEGGLSTGRRKEDHV
jgi:hypothetical protein